MDELVKQIDELMISNAATRTGWNLMTKNEKKLFAAEWYIIKRMKNWNHLPTEIKLECMKTLDFKGRLKLRKTGRQERELVDSLTIDFPFVQFRYPKAREWNGRGRPHPSFGKARVVYPTFSGSSSSLDSDTASLGIKIPNYEKYMPAIHLLAYALQIGKIEKLEVLETRSPDRFNDCAEILEKSAPFYVKNLEIVAKKAAVLMFLKNLEPAGVDSIRLDAQQSHQFPMDEMLTFPAVTSCKLLQIKDLTCSEHPVKLVEKWIENDSPEGTKLQASVRSYGSEFVSKFKDMFADRIEPNEEKQVRVRTNNVTKHVLLKWIRIDHRDYISCFIIPSDYKDSGEAEDVSWTSSCDSIGGVSLLYADSMWDEPEPNPMFDAINDYIQKNNQRTIDVFKNAGFGFAFR